MESYADSSRDRRMPKFENLLRDVEKEYLK
jgi:hypothetical protein